MNIVTLENSLSVAHGTEMMEKHVLLGIDCPLGNLPSRPPGVIQLPVHVLISTLPSLDVLKTPCRIRELLITNVEVWCVLENTELGGLRAQVSHTLWLLCPFPGVASAAGFAWSDSMRLSQYKFSLLVGT